MTVMAPTAKISAPYVTTRQPVAVGSEIPRRERDAGGGARDHSLIERKFEPFCANLRRLERRVEENENGYRRIHRQSRPRRLSIAFAASIRSVSVVGGWSE